MLCKCLVTGPFLHAYIYSLYLSTAKFQSVFHFTFGYFLIRMQTTLMFIECSVSSLLLQRGGGGGSKTVTPPRNLPVNASMPSAPIFIYLV